jgi:hypothetical protein
VAVLQKLLSCRVPTQERRTSQAVIPDRTIIWPAHVVRGHRRLRGGNIGDCAAVTWTPPRASALMAKLRCRTWLSRCRVLG